MFFGDTFLKLPNRVLLWNCFFTNFHLHAKFEGTVSALAAAKKNKSDEVVELWFCKSILCLVKCGNDIFFLCRDATNRKVLNAAICNNQM